MDDLSQSSLLKMLFRVHRKPPEALKRCRYQEPADFRPLKARPYIVPIIYWWQETSLLLSHR
jgi:hypothetical protein